VLAGLRLPRAKVWIGEEPCKNTDKYIRLVALSTETTGEMQGWVEAGVEGVELVKPIHTKLGSDVAPMGVYDTGYSQNEYPLALVTLDVAED
jgi:hypothetical protein